MLTILDAALMAVICALLSSITTSVVWSHSAFVNYTKLIERIAILETKIDAIIANQK